MITYEDYQKTEIRIGRVLSAEKVPDTDKLVKLSVDFGEAAPRQIVSGIALYFPDVSALVGKNCAFVANLEPRTIRGLESNGMILAASTKAPVAAVVAADAVEPVVTDAPSFVPAFSLLEVSSDIPPGTKVS